MTEIDGVITTHLAALGASTRDRSVFAILTQHPHFIEDEPVTADTGEIWIDIANTMEGILLRFREGELDSVRVSARRDAEYYPYPRPADLIIGLDLSTATREDVTELLGEPADGASPDVYAVSGGLLTVTFVGDDLLSVTVSRG